MDEFAVTITKWTVKVRERSLVGPEIVDEDLEKNT